MFKLSKNSKKRMAGVNPDLITIFTIALRNSPIDFGIPADAGIRTAERQNELFEEGVSLCDGYENKSNHQTGNALDFYAYVNGKASWQKHHLAMVAGVIMSTAIQLKREGKINCELKWGAQFGSDDFNGYDFPHIEIKD